MKLSKTQTTFPEILELFLKCTSISSHFFLKKTTLVPPIFPKLRSAQDVVTQMSEKPSFRAPLDSQHVKGFQTLVKSA